MSSLRKQLRMIQSTAEVTTALLVASPTPSGPLLQKKPYQQLTDQLITPKTPPLISP